MATFQINIGDHASSVRHYRAFSKTGSYYSSLEWARTKLFDVAKHNPPANTFFRSLPGGRSLTSLINNSGDLDQLCSLGGASLRPSPHGDRRDRHQRSSLCARQMDGAGDRDPRARTRQRSAEHRREHARRRGRVPLRARFFRRVLLGHRRSEHAVQSGLRRLRIERSRVMSCPCSKSPQGRGRLVIFASRPYRHGQQPDAASSATGRHALCPRVGIAHGCARPQEAWLNLFGFTLGDTFGLDEAAHMLSTQCIP